jgi:hypothetical protein
VASIPPLEDKEIFVSKIRQKSRTHSYNDFDRESLFLQRPEPLAVLVRLALRHNALQILDGNAEIADARENPSTAT